MSLDAAKVTHIDRTAAITHAIKNQPNNQLVISVSATGTPKVVTTARAKTPFSVTATVTPSVEAVARAFASLSVSASVTPSIATKARAAPSVSVPVTVTPNIVGVTTTPLQETLAFRDRVQNAGGTIESGALEELYDPLIEELKNQGHYADTLFLGAASAVENVSGSIATLFSADGTMSGGQNDATQATTSERPTLATPTGFGGRQAADFDGSDDNLVASISLAQPITVVGVMKPEYQYADLFDGGNDRLIVGVDDSTPLVPRLVNVSGSGIKGGTTSKGDVGLYSAVADGASSLLRFDTSQVASGDIGSGGLDLLSLAKGSKSQWGCLVVINASAGSVLPDLEQIIQSYYSL